MVRKLKIKIPNNIKTEDFIKTIPFISKDILDFKLNDKTLILYLSDSVNEEIINKKIQESFRSFISCNQAVRSIFSNNVEREYYTDNEIFAKNEIEKMFMGSICLHNHASLLFDFFDNTFCKLAQSIGAKLEHYPVLLPIDSYKKTSYLKTSPQYSMFCCDAIEDMDSLQNLNSSNDEQLYKYLQKPHLALSPSACFHTYCCHENDTLRENTTVTFIQNVFRNEGRFNWNELGRLRDYHVREVVFFGDEDFVVNQRKNLLELVIEVIKELNLCANIQIAHDPFVIPNMQRFKNIQIQEESKYEVRVNYKKNMALAAASFNLHGTAFTSPFNISIENVVNPVTGCVGFGIERWVLSFVAQYGWNIKNWPEIIKNYIGGTL